MSKKQTKKAESKQVFTWNTIRGTMRIYGNEFEYSTVDKKTKKKVKKTIVRWSVSIGTKLNDEFVNYYLPVSFSQDAGSPVGDGLREINVISGFLTCHAWEDRNGDVQTRPLLMITEYEEIEN